eukprot:539378-Pleurochrysis_carterae.AAC.1
MIWPAASLAPTSRASELRRQILHLLAVSRKTPSTQKYFQTSFITSPSGLDWILLVDAAGDATLLSGTCKFSNPLSAGPRIRHVHDADTCVYLDR